MRRINEIEDTRIRSPEEYSVDDWRYFLPRTKPVEKVEASERKTLNKFLIKNAILYFHICVLLYEKIIIYYIKK